MKKISLDNIIQVFQSKPMTTETATIKGYKLITELFVDNSGLGQDNELGLTQNQFIKELTKLIKEHKTVYTSITNAGQFQVYIGVFIKDNKVKKAIQSKVIANNTVRYTKDNKTIIRLYDTDIMTTDHNKNTITLDTNGHNTPTTKNRMNDNLPQHLYIYQKDYQWYCKDTINKTDTPFTDNETLAINI